MLNISKVIIKVLCVNLRAKRQIKSNRHFVVQFFKESKRKRGTP